MICNKQLIHLYNRPSPYLDQYDLDNLRTIIVIAGVHQRFNSELLYPKVNNPSS